MNTEGFIKELRKKGYKVTPQRLAISEFVLSNRNHFTAEEIYEEIKKKFPSISISTIYQVLRLLNNLGKIHELKFVDNRSRYETDLSPHINAICPKCGKIEDFYSQSIEEFMLKIKQEFKFEPISQHIDIYRYCVKCEGLLV